MTPDRDTANGKTTGVHPGSRLGPYEVTARIGEGGMGVVFEARDSHLRRLVALEVLPEAFTTDADRAVRFEREARVLAVLNHPNIAQIYGLEASGETRALVMELVEGPTLAERLSNGPLPVDESLSIARQLAEALEEAHETGIIHRDLKPQNVKITDRGRVKALDFGLAKAMDRGGSAARPAADLAASPTLTLGATVQGHTLGHGGVHESRTAEGDAGRQPGRHLGLRGGDPRDADGPAAVRRRHRARNARAGADTRARVPIAARRHACRDPAAAPPLPRTQPEEPPAPHRRRAHRARRPQWSPDGRSLFLFDPSALPGRLSEVELETGRRRLVREITPADGAGVPGVMNALITPDRAFHVYTFQRFRTDLYLVTGLRQVAF